MFIVISVVDDGGGLIAIQQMDDAWLASIDIDLNKAGISLTLEMPLVNKQKNLIYVLIYRWYSFTKKVLYSFFEK